MTQKVSDTVRYYQSRFTILIVAFIILAAGWCLLTYRYYQLENGYIKKCAERQQLEETERVMEWKNAWAECMEDIDRYVEESREIVCWDTLVEWQEECDKEMRQCEFTYDDLMECESALARCKSKREVFPEMGDAPFKVDDQGLHVNMNAVTGASFDGAIFKDVTTDWGVCSGVGPYCIVPYNKLSRLGRKEYDAGVKANARELQERIAEILRVKNGQ